MLDTVTRPSQATTTAQLRFELRFESLFDAGRGMSFPCDERGCVELDALSERAKRNYLYARAVIGREYATPRVQAADLH